MQCLLLTVKFAAGTLSLFHRERGDANPYYWHHGCWWEQKLCWRGVSGPQWPCFLLGWILLSLNLHGMTLFISRLTFNKMCAFLSPNKNFLGFYTFISTLGRAGIKSFWTALFKKQSVNDHNMGGSTAPYPCLLALLEEFTFLVFEKS